MPTSSFSNHPEVFFTSKFSRENLFDFFILNGAEASLILICFHWKEIPASRKRKCSETYLVSAGFFSSVVKLIKEAFRRQSCIICSPLIRENKEKKEKDPINFFKLPLMKKVFDEEKDIWGEHKRRHKHQKKSKYFGQSSCVVVIIICSIAFSNGFSFPLIVRKKM